jgi:predicted DNA-binding transcriptional regulator YafY
VSVVEGRTFERPPGFDPRDALPADPKLMGGGGGREARVLIDAARAVAAVADLGDQRVVARRDDGAVEVDVPCDNLAAFRSWLLGFVEHAEVLAPDDVRRHVVDWLESVAS